MHHTAIILRLCIITDVLYTFGIHSLHRNICNKNVRRDILFTFIFILRKILFSFKFHKIFNFHYNAQFRFYFNF